MLSGFEKNPMFGNLWKDKDKYLFNYFFLSTKKTSSSPFTIDFKAFILTWFSCPFTCMSSTLLILLYLHYNIKITSIIPFKPSINYFQDLGFLYLKLNYGKQPHAFKKTSYPHSKRWMLWFILRFSHDPMTSWKRRRIWPCGVPLFGAHSTMFRTWTSSGLVPPIRPP